MKNKHANQTDLNASYIRTLTKSPPLSDANLRELITKAQSGDREAFDRVVQANLRFVVTVAQKFRSSQLCFEELVAEGNLGLIKAVEKFNPDLGYKFTTYAVWWIRQAIQRAVWQSKKPLRLPLNHFDDHDLLRRTSDSLSQQFGRAPSIDEVSEQLDLHPKRLQSVLDLQQSTTHLDMEFKDGGNGHDLLSDDLPDPHEELESQESKSSVRRALKKLPDRDAKIISLTFGLEDDALSFSKVGKKLGISKERVRQLRNRALSRLRNELQAHAPLSLDQDTTLHPSY